MTTALTAKTETPLTRLNPTHLLALYGIIPAVALFLLVDHVLFGERLSRSLPADPHSMQWFNLVFMLPHIFASLFTFMDRDYRQAYRKRLSISVPLFAGIVLALPLLGAGALLMLVIAVYTIYHLINQQTGIAAIIARTKTRSYVAWRWGSLAIYILLYTTMLTGNHDLTGLLQLVFPLLVVIYVVSSFLCALGSKTLIGFYYILANAVMLVASYILFILNQPFFMILIPRVVHDISAFYFYVVHNSNRNSGELHNMLSKLRGYVAIPEYVLTPAAGVLCTAIVMFFLQKYTFFILAFLALFHYYWEGVIWKGGSPHREYIHL